MKNTTNIFIVFIYTIIIIIILSNGSVAKEINHAQKYQACMALSKSAPQKAFDNAINWHGLGGGDAANHCIAIALIGLGQFKESAERLEELALNVKQKADIKVGLLAHAAQAWILADESIRAEEVLTAALKLAPRSALIMIDRAQARAGQTNFTGAIKDLNQAIKLDSHLADAFVFRASAYRQLNKLTKALIDAEEALRLQPKHPEGLLERGNLRRLLHDDKGARKDWLALIESSPKSQAAEDARKNLEFMDLKTIK
jgi:regulator of sirC expression with transglutaminase-like and TPR domain